MSGDANEATEADEAANADEATHFTGPRARALGDVWEGGARKSVCLGLWTRGETARRVLGPVLNARLAGELFAR